MVASALVGLPGERLADAVREVATVAARGCGVLQLCEDATDLDQLVTDLDNIAWDARRRTRSAARKSQTPLKRSVKHAPLTLGGTQPLLRALKLPVMRSTKRSILSAVTKPLRRESSSF